MNCGHKENVVFSNFLYETGARKNEAKRLEWTDLDKERKKVTIKASKNGNARIVSISDDLMSLLFILPRDKETVFNRHSKKKWSIS
jgi:integrase